MFCLIAVCFLWWLELSFGGTLRTKENNIGWDNFCEDKDKGGAGIIHIKTWYKALKQAFRVVAEPNGAWVKQIRALYNFYSWLFVKSDLQAWKIKVGKGYYISYAYSQWREHQRNDCRLDGGILARSAMEAKWSNQWLFDKLKDFIQEGIWNLDKYISAGLKASQSWLVPSVLG